MYKFIVYDYSARTCKKQFAIDKLLHNKNVLKD